MNRVLCEVLMILCVELVSVLFVLCVSSCMVVFDPFEHIFGYMQVEELRWLSLRGFWCFWQEAEQVSALRMNSGSAAEGTFGRRTHEEVASAAQACPRAFGLSALEGSSAAEGAAEG